ncbi:MAG: bifunctional nicotinamidase/pyrazinamidase [Chryseolinea sp.]
MNALILVDIQNDFLPSGSLAVNDGDHIIATINRIQMAFDLLVATQDWHPQAHKSFASNHAGKKAFEVINLNGMPQVLWPDHCIQGTRGSEFHSGLNMDKVEAIFRKGMDPKIDSYSGFYDNGYKKSTGLAGYLHERNVDRVFVCGLAGDFCVAFTAKDSIKEDFETYVIEDVIKSIDEDGYQRIKTQLEKVGVKFINSDQIVGVLGGE